MHKVYANSSVSARGRIQYLEISFKINSLSHTQATSAQPKARKTLIQQRKRVKDQPMNCDTAVESYAAGIVVVGKKNILAAVQGVLRHWQCYGACN